MSQWQRWRSDDWFSDDLITATESRSAVASRLQRFEGGWSDELASYGEQQTLSMHVCTILQWSCAAQTLLSLGRGCPSFTCRPSVLHFVHHQDQVTANAQLPKLPVYCPRLSGSRNPRVRPANQAVEPGLSPPDVTSHIMFPWRGINGGETLSHSAGTERTLFHRTTAGRPAALCLSYGVGST